MSQDNVVHEDEQWIDDPPMIALVIKKKIQSK